MYLSKNDYDNNPITEKDEVADVLLNMNKNDDSNATINMCALPMDDKECTPIGFYVIAIKLVEKDKNMFYHLIIHS